MFGQNFFIIYIYVYIYLYTMDNLPTSTIQKVYEHDLTYKVIR